MFGSKETDNILKIVQFFDLKIYFCKKQLKILEMPFLRYLQKLFANPKFMIHSTFQIFCQKHCSLLYLESWVPGFVWKTRSLSHYTRRVATFDSLFTGGFST